MNEHRLAEERCLAYHRAIAAKLRADPTALERARRRVTQWISEDGIVDPYYAARWHEALQRPLDGLVELLTDPSEHARALRQVSPFAGALTPQERWRVWREVGERWRATP